MTNNCSTKHRQLKINLSGLHAVDCVWFVFYSIFTIPANKDAWFHMFWKWIHEFNWLNSLEFTGFYEQIWCVDTCLLRNHEFFTWWHVPVKPYQFWPSTTCVKLVQNSKLVTTDRTRVFTWIHMKRCTGGAVPIMNQYDTCQPVQKWILVCWDITTVTYQFKVYKIYI